MNKKQINLSTQYMLKSFIILLMLILYMASRENFGFSYYEPVVSKLYYGCLLLYGLIGLIWKNEEIDESAERILGKVSGICLNAATLGLIILALFVAAPMFKGLFISRDLIGLLLFILLFLITALKSILFYVFDRRGLYNGSIKH
ncbi:MAG: hypothetical protein M0Q14_07765 [Tissierellaceae bacterium]|nr:hypothetical protein [Tissierellaceae bacterium]